MIIRIKGIAPGTTADELMEHLSDAGTVRTVHVHKRNAFVDMADEASAKQAIAVLNGIEVNGQQWTVRFADPMKAPICTDANGSLTRLF